MQRYRTATSLRQALEARLNQQQKTKGTDLARLRRRAAFDRLATRLAVDAETGWILKGGTALEFRLLNRARATKDIDLAIPRSDLDGDAVRRLLRDAVNADPDGDWFQFRVGEPEELCLNDAGLDAWRIRAEASLAGRRFSMVQLDIVAQGGEVKATERLALPGILEFAGFPARSILAVDRAQHFAEKIHAMACDRGQRVNTRVKDLVDLVLLIENGLAADRAVVVAVRHVFGLRGRETFPVDVPEPPKEWEEIYPGLAEGLTEAEPEMNAAMDLVRAFWTRALRDEGSG